MDIFVAKNLLLFSLMVLISGLCFLVKLWPQGVDSTFSRHAATSKISYTFYILVFATSLPMLIAFFSHWFLPAYGIPKIFLSLVVTACCAQILCTFFIEKGRWIAPHRILAGISALILIPCTLILMTASEAQAAPKTFFTFGFIIMLTIIVVTLIRKDTLKKQMLYQAGYYGAFFIPILLATYW